MTGSKIEEVAEAIWADHGFAKLHPEGFAARPPIVRESYLRDAIAAVRALREPTEAMEMAGNDALSENGVCPVDDSDAPVAWRAMIDSILADTGES